MNFFRKLFGAKSQSPRAASTPPASAAPAPTAASPASPAADFAGQSIRVHDAYGREHQLTKEQWRDSVLLPHLEKVRDQPEELAAVVAQSLRDGFAAEVLPFAAHLASVDPQPERGHVLHAAALLDLKQHAEAEALLLRFIEKHGDSALALANLAKARSARGDDSLALETLWRALRLDPNQEAALGWYAGHHREKQGPAAALGAFLRVSELPGAWRARLWLARHQLEERQLPSALKLYDEAIDQAPRPVPADLLQQMSGDLGNHAHLPELLQLTAPYYDVARHGLPTGNNLLKAYHDLGQLEAARRLLDRLYAQKRPDWKQNLAFWDAELAKSRIAVDNTPTTPSGVLTRPGAVPGATAASPAPAPAAPVEVTLLAVEGPVWLPPESPAAELFPAKADDAPLVAFLGASAELPPPPASDAAPGRAQLGDGPGRLSRALPLYLTEQVELQTAALARTLVPWVVKPRPGFILGGIPWDDATASRHARAVVPDDAADYLVVTHLRCVESPWTIELRLVRTIDAACLATASVSCPSADPGQALPELTRVLLEALAAHADIATAPAPSSVAPSLSSAYLLRLEQLLAVRTAGIEPAKSPLNGEREILDGQLHLCLEQPESVPVRLLFAHTLRAMKRVRPDILPEVRERVELLQKEKPLPEPAHSVAARVFAEAFG